MVALTAGRVRLSSLSSSGRELLLGYAEPGDLFGEITCLDGVERDSDATAVAKATSLVVSRQLFQQVAERYPQANAAAVKHLCSVIRDTNDRLEAVAFCHLQARLARFLLSSLIKAHGSGLEPNPHLSLGLSQADLGRIIRASRPKVNRLLQEFRRRRVLVQVGMSWQCDVAALRQIAHEEI
jgi:CRP/FNR family transcriptional regulator, cyclic AMP receptor protein